MTETLPLLRTLLTLKEPAVLATVVAVEGSAYRRPGAQALFTAEGLRQGALSGGCLESDLAARAAQVLSEGTPRRVRYDLALGTDAVWGFGSGCEGTVDLLLEAVRPEGRAPWIPFTEQLLGKRREVGLVTVTAVEGSVACALGDRFAYDDHLHGLQPGDRELNVQFGRAVAAARAAGRTQTARVERPEGAVELLVEPLQPVPALWIYGAGEGARALARLAHSLGWEVGVFDHRPALATRERFPEAVRLGSGAPADLLRVLPKDGRCAGLVMSHVFERDKAALAAFLDLDLPYVGLLGHRKRGDRMLQELESEGRRLTPEDRDRLHHPVGLDLGGETPEAIALAILAEVQAVLSKRTGGFLRDRSGPIHG